MNRGFLGSRGCLLLANMMVQQLRHYTMIPCGALVLPILLCCTGCDGQASQQELAQNEKSNGIVQKGPVAASVLDSPDGVRNGDKELEICPQSSTQEVNYNNTKSIKIISSNSIKDLIFNKEIKFKNNRLGSSEIFKYDGQWTLGLYQDVLTRYSGKWYISQNSIISDSEKYGKICRHIFIDQNNTYYMEPITEATHDKPGKIFPISFSDVGQYIGK